ncbi:hypothetical protein L5515_009481 [Caenorhabditis briggsae]|uniref:Uncharacterized protein n=1 Tax=Caenorhabditis briggsae TaxID=6238 RepID=A0AAE9F9X0_CAEBR|nr:hypothetical protein L5515_009481 [Caenorhabditis briggsae]
MVKGKSAGTVEGSVKFADFEKKFPVYNLCQSYFETTINIIFCSSSSTEAKMYKTRSSDAVSATEDVIHLKECFVKSPTFEYCDMTIKPTDANRELSVLWGPSNVSETEDDGTWYFRMANSDILVVSVEMQDTWPYWFYINLYREEHNSDIDSVGIILHD